MMESGKRNADLEEWDAKIRKLTEEFESDTELEECDTENEIGELTAEIDNLTAELEERDRKISKLTSDLGDCDAKIKERDRKITKLAAEIRRLTALLGKSNFCTEPPGRIVLIKSVRDFMQLVGGTSGGPWSNLLVLTRTRAKVRPRCSGTTSAGHLQFLPRPSRVFLLFFTKWELNVQIFGRSLIKYN
ncbi:PREDICTED: uncharacterized protein LOC103922920 isoform X3 [Pygoscelis adeliae]|uniref:uncharacterized protein LOC103922920 isoform X3 n=1 Tax=Pygoscelis adeliae TaxID=9238 RepID=UPI0004F4FA3D|nr:PREDICTED: uncharacterized protein LOC103922920 isoform X3 [Pygoscelis adeliae]